MNQSRMYKKKPRGRGAVKHLERSGKAAQIEAVLSDFIGQELKNFDILDIGCGNGGISTYFARHNHVVGVDIQDVRWKEHIDFEFHLIDSEQLPFEREQFNIVISNHVIEHVTDQRAHLSEIHRILKPSGIVYMATPNKSSPIMEGHVGNEMVLHYREMASLFESAGFYAHEYSIPLLKQPDRFYGEIKSARFLPAFVLKSLRTFFPSHVFVLHKA